MFQRSATESDTLLLFGVSKAQSDKNMVKYSGFFCMLIAVIGVDDTFSHSASSPKSRINLLGLSHQTVLTVYL